MPASALPAATCPGCAAPLKGPVLLRGRDRLMGGPGEFAVLRCGECGLASTQPRIGANQFADYYPADYYPVDRHPADHHSDVGQHVPADGRRPVPRTALMERMRLAAIIRLGPYRPLSHRRPGRMLDVGCGNGELAGAFARRGWKVAGVEPAAAAAARALAAGLEMHRGTLDDAPWRGPTFDAVVFNHSLEHLPDPLSSLRQAAALLREGGMVAVAVPNFGCWQRRVFGSRWFQLDLPRHLQHLDANTLAALLARAGLRPVAQATASMRPSLLVSLQYAAFGRARWMGRGLRLAAWTMAPLLWVLDRLAAGDCLHVFAVPDPSVSAAERSSLAPEHPSPAPGDLSPALEHPSPGPGDLSPAPEHPSPALEHPSPAPEPATAPA